MLPEETIGTLDRNGAHPNIVVYYHALDQVFFTPWTETTAQILAGGEDSNTRFYFFWEEPT